MSLIFFFYTYKKKQKIIKVYTAPYFGDSYLSSSTLAGYPLWVAEYGVSSPRMPGRWSSYRYWLIDKNLLFLKKGNIRMQAQLVELAAMLIWIKLLDKKVKNRRRYN